MIRMLVQLADAQARTLRRFAAERRLSMAAVVRKLVDTNIGAAASVQTARARGAVGRFGSGRDTVSREHDRALDTIFGD